MPTVTKTYRLMAGSHIQKEQVGKNAEGNPIYESKTYREGQKVRSSKNLVELFGAPKFQLLSEYEAAAPEEESPKKVEGEEDDGLERMTVAQLKDYAAQHEIDLEDATHKADIIAAIRLNQ